jgi:hypothetical protein
MLVVAAGVRFAPTGVNHLVVLVAAGQAAQEQPLMEQLIPVAVEVEVGTVMATDL